MIIGLTGKNASGKGEVASYLKNKGFVHLSLSEELRGEAKEKNVKPERENLIALGNELREKFGANCLAKKINNKIIKIHRKLLPAPKGAGLREFSFDSGFLGCQKSFIQHLKMLVFAFLCIKKNKNNFVVDSIRNLEEIKELRKNKNFILIAVDAPIELRFQRAIERGRAGDAKTLEEFKRLEEKENFKNKTGQQLNQCIGVADNTIINNNSLESLHKKVDSVLDKLE